MRGPLLLDDVPGLRRRRSESCKRAAILNLTHPSFQLPWSLRLGRPLCAGQGNLDLVPLETQVDGDGLGLGELLIQKRQDLPEPGWARGQRRVRG